MFNISKFYIGKLNEDSLPLLFRCEPLQKEKDVVREDKDVGFDLLKVKRDELCSVLLKAGKVAHEALSPEIFEALANLSTNKDNFWAQDSETPRLLEEGSKLVRKKQEVEADLRKMVNELFPNFTGDTTVDVAVVYCRIQLKRKPNAVPQQTMSSLEKKIENFDEIKGAVDAFCKSDQLFQSYVRDGLGKRMGLGCESALFFAQEKGINLRIWCPVSGKKDLLVRMGSSRPNPSLPIDLLWHEDKGHFEGLSIQQPISSQSTAVRTPASSPSKTLRAVDIVGTVEGAPSRLIQNLSYRLLFSPLVAERRNAARNLAAMFPDTEFLTNILLIALLDADPVVFHLVDKLLEKLRFDRHKLKEPISVLVTYTEYSINMDQRCIVVRSILENKPINVDQLHKPSNPDFVDERPHITDYPLPQLHEYSPCIARSLRQKGETMILSAETLKGGFKHGGITFNIGGRTTGAFDDPAGNVPRPVSASASPQPTAVNNPSEPRATNFISNVTKFLKEVTPDNKTKMATTVRIIWPRVQGDPNSIQKARELYADLSSGIKENLQNLYPDIHKDLISTSPLSGGDKTTP